MQDYISAIFDAGVFRPLDPVDLPDGTPAEIRVALDSGDPSESQQISTLAWHDFVERTYGSCSELGLERREQGEFELREPTK